MGGWGFFCSNPGWASTMPGLLPAVSLLRERQGVGSGHGWFTKWAEGPQGLARLPLPPHGDHPISPLSVPCSRRSHHPVPTTWILAPPPSQLLFFLKIRKPQRAEAIPTQPSPPLCLLVPVRGHLSLLQDTPCIPHRLSCSCAGAKMQAQTGRDPPSRPTKCSS